VSWTDERGLGDLAEIRSIDRRKKASFIAASFAVIKVRDETWVFCAPLRVQRTPC
jgi:hypothetical protein